MGLFKRNPFGHILFIKKWLIRIFGGITHRRYRGFNQLHIDGSEIIRALPDKNVLFISNHQTYFADVVAMFHVFNASLSGRADNIKNVGYLWQPKMNIYYVAAKETMTAGLLPRILSYVGAISVERTWRAKGEDVAVKRSINPTDSENIKIALADVSRPYFATRSSSWFGVSFVQLSSAVKPVFTCSVITGRLWISSAWRPGGKALNSSRDW